MEFASHALIRGLQEVGFVGSWERDFATGMMRTSPDLAMFYGLSTSGGEVEHHRYIDLEASICPDDLPRIDHWRRRGIDPAGIGTIEYRVRDRHANIRWVLCRAAYRRDDDGRILEGRGIVFDVTSSKRAQSVATSSLSAPGDTLGRLADLLLEAHRLAELVGDPALIEGVGLGLLQAGWLLKNEIVTKKMH